ncbi:SDR family oxidoreductase [Nocardioides sp. NBC_00368]|uniref:SDR family oxidoreductase n=1 Tax=Nocardioides sp. NBC_00368 TaxID=2976000 RepID=UPI002E223830
MRIAVAGGTGVLGRHVVEVAQARGHDAVVFARGQGVDLVAGTGLAAALDGVEVVVDVTSIPTQSARESDTFYRTVTRNLLTAETAAGVAHHLALSIVGAVEAPYGYYSGKALQEQLVSQSKVPWTIQRATQFHEIAGQITERLRRGPFLIVPKMRCQPVSAREVAARLIDLAEAGPAGRVPDFGGPQDEQMVDMVRALKAATGMKGWVVPTPLPGAVGRALRDGTLIPGPGADHGTETFDAWLRSGAASDFVPRTP